MKQSTTSKNQASALSRLFSSAVIHDLATRGKSALFARLVSEAGLVNAASDRVAEVFDRAFQRLKSDNRRDEYVFRSAITHNILLGRHSLNTASMLSEFRVGQCKADLVILNGVATAYEIKSERDSLSRLQNQIETYRTVFPQVNVVVAESHAEAALRVTPKDVGILQLNKHQRVSTIRKAQICVERISPDQVFQVLRGPEAKRILETFGLKVPKVPNTQLHAEMRKQFARLRPDQAHFGMLTTLKTTRSQKYLGDLVDQLPRSLQPAALSIPIKRGDHAMLLRAVNARYSEALNWNN